ncbi:MAG: hypothetical protein PVJ80_17225 [Gemmatimonadota bacterium]|jgi:hypothetical protein
MSRVTSWEEYLTRLCLERWSLDPAATIQIMKCIDSLVAPGQVSDHSVATILRRGGVAFPEARSVAPSIRMAICA